jgi:hypothetical protein
MRDLVTKGTLRIDCGIGTYFDALDSCDSLEWEILSHTPGLKRSDERAFRRFDLGLQHRRDLHYLVQDPIRSGAYRSVAVAVSTLVAYETSDSIRLMIKHRSSRGVAVHSDLTHVIPSFMFQPATGDLLREYSIRHNIYREYLEELFDRPEPEPGALSAIYFYKERTCGIC